MSASSSSSSSSSRDENESENSIDMKKLKGKDVTDVDKDESDKDNDNDEDAGGSSGKDDLDLGPAEEDSLEEAFGAVPPLCLSFKNLSYSVTIKKGPFSDGIKGVPAKLRSCKLRTRENKSILKPMSGHFLPGRLVAIMGPSGTVSSSY